MSESKKNDNSIAWLFDPTLSASEPRLMLSPMPLTDVTKISSPETPTVDFKPSSLSENVVINDKEEDSDPYSEEEDAVAGIANGNEEEFSTTLHEEPIQRETAMTDVASHDASNLLDNAHAQKKRSFLRERDYFKARLRARCMLASISFGFFLFLAVVAYAILAGSTILSPLLSVIAMGVVVILFGAASFSMNKRGVVANIIFLVLVIFMLFMFAAAMYALWTYFLPRLDVVVNENRCFYSDRCIDVSEGVCDSVDDCVATLANGDLCNPQCKKRTLYGRGLLSMRLTVALTVSMVVLFCCMLCAGTCFLRMFLTRFKLRHPKVRRRDTLLNLRQAQQEAQDSDFIMD